MKKNRTISVVVAGIGILGSCLFLGCATHLRKPAEAPQPTKERFAEFKAYEMKHVEIAPAYAKASANQKAGRKINQLLFAKMALVLPGIAASDKATELAKPAVRTLLIEPKIEEIKFVGGAARFWVGAMAGSSAVLMKVTYKDKATGVVVAEPEFYQQANAFAGGNSMGMSDNFMLDQIVMEICNYTSLNR